MSTTTTTSFFAGIGGGGVGSRGGDVGAAVGGEDGGRRRPHPSLSSSSSSSSPPPFLPASSSPGAIPSGGGGGVVSSSSSSVVLVTGPRCADPVNGIGRFGVGRAVDPDGAVDVQPERCEDVDLGGADPNRRRNPIMQFLGDRVNLAAAGSVLLEGVGGFGRARNDPGEPTELREMAPSSAAVGGDFDTCREYGYSADEYDTSIGTAAGLAPSVVAPVVETSLRTHVLGRSYHPLHDYGNRRDDESSLFWFTYRCDFPEIAPYGITSDAGWGCMLRSAQMLLAQALRLHFKCRSWRPSQVLSGRRQDPFVRSVLTWFADYPSSTDCLYSLHNMVAAGLSKYEKLPGEWYGPGTACYVLRDLVAVHERQQSEAAARKTGPEQQHRGVFRVHVASQGTVYRDSIHELMTKEFRRGRETNNETDGQEIPLPSHPLDLDWEDELVESSGDAVEWDTSLLLLVPLRLGLQSFNDDYVRAVAHTFSLPQSVGVLGGRPRGARWFYGAVSDGSKIFGLDPHTVQTAPRRRTARVNGRSSSVVELSDDYLRSCHTTSPEVFSLQKMDPSVALGFYCRDRDDMEHLFSSLRSWRDANPGSTELFSVADAAPDYASNLASSDDMMTMSSLHNNAGGGGDAAHCDAGDEDDYVML